jgi:hypothetical protein
MDTQTLIAALSKWMYQDQSFQRVLSYPEMTGKPGESTLRAGRNDQPKAKKQFKQKEVELDYED